MDLTTETHRKRRNSRRHNVKTSKENSVANHANYLKLNFDLSYTIKAIETLPKD